MKRAPKAVWSDRDTKILVWLVSFYKRRHVDYAAIARVFADCLTGFGVRAHQRALARIVRTPLPLAGRRHSTP